MEDTIDVTHPCSACNRYTCRCAEAPERIDLLTREPVLMREAEEMWTPWAAFAANA